MNWRYEIRPVDSILANFFDAPPAYVRLEPQSVTGDPLPGLEAALHDPLWSLLRQWQFGEFAGEDAGQPLSAVMTWTASPIEGYALGPSHAGASPGVLLGEDELLDPLVEVLPHNRAPDLRARADAGGLLVTMLADAELVPDPPLDKLYPFEQGEIDEAPAWLRPVLRRMVDGAEAAAVLRHATLPPWLVAAAPAAREAALAWASWYERSVAPFGGTGGWQRDRLEYQFSLGTRDEANKRRTFVAEEHLGGALHWWSLDEAGDRNLEIADAGRRFTPEPGVARRDFRGEGPQIAPVKLVQPLRFAGMPADRLWEFEDATVNLGAMDVQVNDPARLCLIEFASVYGNDWFLLPLEVPAAAFTTVTSLSVRDTFGEHTTIAPASDLAGRFRLYEVSRHGDPRDPTVHGLLTLPSAGLTMEGPAQESVHFVRDEIANMVWAIEETVASVADGRPRRRAEERSARPSPPPLMDGAELRYTLESEVPRYWIPFVPIADGQGGFKLRKGTLTGDNDSASLLLEGTHVDLLDAEIPGEGLRVERVPAVARAADGSLLRWTCYRVRPGSGPGNTGLAFDSATEPERPV